VAATSWFWNVHRCLPHSGGESLSADRGACEMEDSPGHSLHLEEQSKVDLLGFLVWYADCVAISQAERHQHALRHPLVRSHRASLTQSCTNCAMKASRQWPNCQHFLRRDAGSCFVRTPHGDPAPTALVICPGISWQSSSLLHLNCPDTLVPLSGGGVYDFASVIR
jgi:hypothetical protein